MSMTRKLWSINALATEFDLDRRTVAARIKDIPPAGQRRGHPAWRLADIADLLIDRSSRVGRAEAAPPVPPGLAIMATVDRVSAAAILTALLLVYRLPAQAAALAIGAGADCRTAWATGLAMRVAACEALATVARESGLEPFASDPEVALIDPTAFDENDWQHLAATAGEPVDEASWQAWAEERFGSE